MPLENGHTLIRQRVFMPAWLIDATTLEKRVIVRIVQAGFAVVATTEAPHIRVEYRADKELHILVKSGAAREQRARAFWANSVEA